MVSAANHLTETALYCGEMLGLVVNLVPNAMAAQRQVGQGVNGVTPNLIYLSLAQINGNMRRRE